MIKTTFQREVDVAIRAVQEASKVILEVYEQDFEVAYKDRREPVTLADKRANELLCAAIGNAFPDDAVLAEESVPSDPDELARRVHHKRLWLIDPLDGTKEFIARNGEFAVMVGLAIDGEATVGVVAAPATGQIFVGVVGEGAWLIDGASAPVPLQVSSVDQLELASMLVSRSHQTKRLVAVAESLGTRKLVACGSVGVKASRIVRSLDDIYVNLHEHGGAKLWDGCAPEAMVRGAGGRVTDIQGRRIDYATTNLELAHGYVATNGLLHDAVIAATRG